MFTTDIHCLVVDSASLHLLGELLETAESEITKSCNQVNGDGLTKSKTIADFPFTMAVVLSPFESVTSRGQNVNTSRSEIDMDFL